MNKAEEIKRLKAEKKELERKIRALESNAVEYGRVLVSFGGRPEQHWKKGFYCLKVKCSLEHGFLQDENRERFYTIATSEDISRIEDYLRELQSDILNAITTINGINDYDAN